MDLQTFHGTGNVQVGTGAAVAAAISSDSSNQWIAIKWTGHLANQFQAESGGGYAAAPNSQEDLFYSMLELGITKTAALAENARNFAVSTTTLPPISLVAYNNATYKRKTFNVYLYAPSSESTDFKASEI